MDAITLNPYLGVGALEPAFELTARYEVGAVKQTVARWAAINEPPPIPHVRLGFQTGKVHDLADEVFEREEDHIVLKLTLPYPTLVLGGEVTVPTLVGKTFDQAKVLQQVLDHRLARDAHERADDAPAAISAGSRAPSRSR